MALTRALALEFARDGIRVNAVLPGAVDTPMLRSGLSRSHVTGDSIEQRMADLARRTVMGRIGEPAEIGRAILWLADTQQASFVTGQSIIVDGGATARLSTE
jgi:NAD(P)-dependent dehydrogenase (short-subunit alcohol dehydrogenase family)